MAKFDFSGYATKNDIKCSDGRVIRRNAFLENDGEMVPLVWHHRRDEPSNVIGHALLENRSDGVYAYGIFNDTENGKTAKTLVKSGDITHLSIYANRLQQSGNDVMHGCIREVSLVVAGANPGAVIDNIPEPIVHEDGSTEYSVDMTKAIIYHEDAIDSNDVSIDMKIEHEDDKKEEPKMANTATKDEPTLQDVLDTMNDQQRDAVAVLLALAVADAKGDSEAEHDETGDDSMQHNEFDAFADTGANGTELTHAEFEEFMSKTIADGKKYGSMKESYLEHTQEYGIENIDYLFPDTKTINTTPDFIKRPDSWVSVVMNGVHHTPFSRIKSIHADITENDARAKGYIKGNLKTEEVFGLLKRETTPQTIYKKQKLDRDDVIDITDFDVIAWLKQEMRMMLDEEIARAILIGDGRLATSPDKINPNNIRPIYTDSDLYSIKVPIDRVNDGSGNYSEEATAKSMIKKIIKARKDYRGTGEPTFYVQEDWLTEMLLLEDGMGRRLYPNMNELATALRVSRIVAVPVMDNVTRDVTITDGQTTTVVTRDLIGIIINLTDYNVGADKGGAVSLFDDFDIDYNQMKYLIETRISGALTKPFSAMVVELNPAPTTSGEG